MKGWLKVGEMFGQEYIVIVWLIGLADRLDVGGRKRGQG